MKKLDLKQHIDSWDLEKLQLPIEDTFGDNLVLKNAEGRDLKTYANRDKDGCREIILDITSYRGSIGAVHFYGKLKDYSLRFTYLEDKSCSYSIGGSSMKGVPKQYTDLSIDMQRPVEQRDLDHDEAWGRESCLRVEIGNLTRGFWEEKDVVELGKKMFKAIYKGKWKLRINSYSGKYDKNVIR